MSEQSTEGDVDLRRRAAWLLAMLVLVAVLVVVVMTTLLGTDKGGGGNGNAVGPDPITSTGPPSASRTPSSAQRTTRSSGSPTSASSSAPTSGVATGGPTTCPTSTPCTFDTDIGNATAAINAYRTEHGLAPVPTTVSAAAKTCAVDKGDGCDGGWAWTSISAPADGQAAVAKIVQFAKLLQPGTTSIGIGWAYDPGAKLYYFSTIRES